MQRLSGRLGVMRNMLKVLGCNLIAFGFVLFPMTGKAQIAWTMQTLPRDGHLSNPVYGAGKFFASPVGGWGDFQQTAVSTNGISWAITKQPKNFVSIASNGLNHFVGIDREGAFYSSKDGAVWTPVGSAIANLNPSFLRIEFSGDRYVGVCNVSGSGSYQYFYSSPDFLEWTFKDLILPSGYYFSTGISRQIAFGKGVFAVHGVKVSGGADLYKTSIFTTEISASTGGAQNWTSRIDWVGSTIYGPGAIRYLNNQFIHAGQTGIHTSINGTSWKKVPTSEGVQFYDVAFGNSTLVAVGPVGSVYTSRDNGVTWIKNTTNVWSNFTGVCFGGGKFICTGPLEGVLKSP